VEIRYDTKKLVKQCDGEKAIKRNFPNEAKSILKRVQDMEDFPTLKDYLNGARGNPHPLRENLKGWFWVHVNGPNVIIFEPLTEVPDDETGNPDYSQVTAINIIAVNVPEADYKK